MQKEEFIQRCYCIKAKVHVEVHRSIVSFIFTKYWKVKTLKNGIIQCVPMWLEHTDQNMMMWITFHNLWINPFIKIPNTPIYCHKDLYKDETFSREKDFNLKMVQGLGLVVSLDLKKKHFYPITISSSWCTSDLLVSAIIKKLN